MQKNLEARMETARRQTQKKLQEVFGQVHDYWSKKGVDDATTLSVAPQDAYGDVATEAAAGKFDDASASLKKASATRGGCHSVHREKAADGTWKIK